MLKKWSTVVGMFVLLFALTACNSNKEASSSATNKSFEANIESASYILTGNDDGVSEQENLGQLAVDIKVKNTSKNAISLFSDGIVLYDGEEQINPIRDAYNSKINLQYEANGNIAPDKMKTITVVFEVEKDKEYQIGIKPLSDDYDEEIKELTLKLATVDYAESFDKLQDSAKAAAAYIDTIYVDKENSDYETFVTADKAAAQDGAKSLFKDRVKNIFEEDLQDEDVVKLYTGYKEVMAQKATIEAKTIASGNGKAVVSIEYTSVPLNDLYDKAYKFQREFREKTGSYDSVETDQYVLSKFDSILQSLDTYEGRDPLEIVMIQKDGKWELDPSDPYSEYVSEIFAAGSKY